MNVIFFPPGGGTTVHIGSFWVKNVKKKFLGDLYQIFYKKLTAYVV